MPNSSFDDVVVRLREVENKLAVLQTDSKHTIQYIDKLDQTMSKLTEVSSNLSRILAVQEQRLSEQEKNMIGYHEWVKTIDNNVDGLSVQVSGKIDDTKLTEVKKKVDRIEKIMYVSWGGLSVLIFLITQYGKDLIKIIPGVN